MKRWHQTGLVIIALWLATSAPQIAGWLNQSDAQRYLARIPSNPSDTAAYYSDIEQARQGRWLFANQLTSEPQRPSLFHPLWLVTGWLAARGHLTTPVAFQAVRLIALALFVIVLDSIISQIFGRRRHQLIALAIVTTSSGLGWLVAGQTFNGRAILGAPVDLWVDEANTFRSFSHSALFIGSQLLLLLVLWATYRQSQGQPVRYTRWVGPCLALLGLIHPYDLVSAGAVAVVWLSVWLVTDAPDRSRFKIAIRTVATWWLWVIPVAVYYLALPWQQAAMRGWFLQNTNPSPSVAALLMGFGLLLPLAAVGAVTSWRARGRLTPFLVCWAVTVLVIIYTPQLSIQRRLLSGVHVPLALLAAAGFVWLLERNIVNRLKPAAALLGVAALAITNLKLLQADVRDTRYPNDRGYPIYASRGTMRALDWLRRNSAVDDVVLANFWDGNTVAGLAGRPVVFAHPNQTVASWKREQDWETFIRSTTAPDDRQAVVSRLGVRWLYWTEPDTPGGYHPEQDARWLMRYRDDDLAIYQLQGR